MSYRVLASQDFSAFDDRETSDNELANVRLPANPPPEMPGSYNFEPQDQAAPPLRTPPRRPVRPGSREPAHSRGFSLSIPHSLTSIFNRLRPPTARRPVQPESDSEDHRLLFQHDEDDNTLNNNSVGENNGRYPPSHIPLPPRPNQFSQTQTPSSRVMGSGQGNDGVFANLSAKPDGFERGAEYVGGDENGGDKDEPLPAYEVAAMDSAPPYWESTVYAPTLFTSDDDIYVDGLPVGNVFSFMWNFLVSMSFQFVGFLLTYLLHTTHAAKNGSMAGLGVTLIQLGFYLKEQIDNPYTYNNNPSSDATGLNGAAGPGQDIDNGRWTWWGGYEENPDPSGTASALGSLPTQIHGALQGALDSSDPNFPTLQGNTTSSMDELSMNPSVNQWIAVGLVTMGSFLFIGGCLAYWRAIRFAKAVRAGMAGNDVEQRIE